MKTSAAGPIIASAVAALLISTPALSKEYSAPDIRTTSDTSVGLSQQAKAQADAQVSGRVQREFDFSLGDVTQILTPAQLRAALGVGDDSVDSGAQQLERIEVQAPRHEQVESRIPFGLASIAWAVKHPSEAWRVFTPAVVS